MSAVFATVLTVTHFGETFVEPWRVNPQQPAPITLRLPRTSVRARDPQSGATRFETVTAVVPRGQVVRAEPLATLVRLYERERRPPRPTRLAAQWLVYFLLVLMGTAYMRQASSERAGLLRVQVSLLALSAILLVGSKIGMLFSDLPPFVLPVSLVPLWASLYVDKRTGVMLSLLITLCGSSLVAYDPVVTAVYLMSTTTASLAFRGRRRVATLVPAGAGGGLVAAVVYIAAREIYDGFDVTQELALLHRSGPVTALLGGLGAGVLGLLLHAPVSRMFGIVSRGELLNLSDLEQPLLQKMQNEAPGSWEHSRMMANLAEAAAASIHADALLTRVGAYYHDLGKSVQPQYFVENLLPGETSPHENLDPDVSADAIMAHVVEGVRILREGGIPEAVIEFAYTHHGTSVIEYFWHKCKKAGNPKGLTEEAFRYPGMRPRSRETGILMLIDAIEAGARTVTPPTREKFDELVRRVIFSKLKQGQLDESGLSLEELRIVTARIVDSLCSAYHSRIKYPWQEKQEKREKQEKEDKQAQQEQAAAEQSTTGRQAAVRKGEKARGDEEATTTTGKLAAQRKADKARTETDTAEAGTTSDRQAATRRAEAGAGASKERRASDDGSRESKPRERRASNGKPKPDAESPEAGLPVTQDNGRSRPEARKRRSDPPAAREAGEDRHASVKESETREERRTGARETGAREEQHPTSANDAGAREERRTSVEEADAREERRTSASEPRDEARAGERTRGDATGARARAPQQSPTDVIEEASDEKPPDAGERRTASS